MATKTDHSLQEQPDVIKSLPSAPSKRNPYEQQEFQRKNPHLFTTPTQSVNPDGSIMTYQQVTAKLQETYDKLEANARVYAAAHKFNPDFWYLMDDLHETKEATDYLATQMKLCLRGFTDNYGRMHQRHTEGIDLVALELFANTDTANPPKESLTDSTNEERDK